MSGNFSKSAVEFRPVVSGVDIAAAVSLAREIWQEHYPSIIGQGQVDYMLERFQSADAVARQIAEGHEYYFVVCGDQAAGYIAIAFDSGASTMMLSKIYIKKSLRGLGFGKRALEFAEDICRRRGLGMIWLTVNKDNAGSVAWYEKMGFINAGATVRDIGNGFIMDDFRMEKRRMAGTPLLFDNHS